jgi:hypothetical protein
MASWRSGDAEDCKSLYPGSIPGEASKKLINKINDLPEIEPVMPAYFPLQTFAKNFLCFARVSKFARSLRATKCDISHSPDALAWPLVNNGARPLSAAYHLVGGSTLPNFWELISASTYGGEFA